MKIGSYHGPTGELRIIEVPDTQDLADLKTELKAEIDAAAGRVRLRYITDVPGQAKSYERKLREAMQAIDDPDPDASEYPLLAVSIGIEVPDTGNAKTDFDAIAALVISREVTWAQNEALIERVRRTAKAGITAATTDDQARAAATVVWPS